MLPAMLEKTTTGNPLAIFYSRHRVASLDDRLHSPLGFFWVPRTEIRWKRQPHGFVASSLLVSATTSAH